MIVITGVTGHLGRLAADDVLTKVPADQVAVVARNPEKAKAYADRGVEVRQGDYSQPETLVRAFAGADQLLFVSSPDITPGTRQRQHRDVVDAAVQAGAGRVVYTSAITADTGPGFLADHTVTESALRESGLTFTLLRNTFYHHYFVNPGLGAAIEAGELAAAVIGHPLVTATIDELALAASAALTGDGHENAVYELRGTPWTYAELAQTLASVSGQAVAHREMADDDVDPTLAFQLPLLRLPEFGEPTPDLERLIGRQPISLEASVRAALSR